MQAQEIKSAVEQLESIREQVIELLEGARQIVDEAATRAGDVSIARRAESYWIAHALSAMASDDCETKHETTIATTIDELTECLDEIDEEASHVFNGRDSADSDAEHPLKGLSCKIVEWYASPDRAGYDGIVSVFATLDEIAKRFSMTRDELLASFDVDENGRLQVSVDRELELSEISV